MLLKSYRLIMMSLFILFFLLVALSGCGRGERAAAPRIIERSDPTTPAWIMDRKTSPTHVYFVGLVEGQPSLGQARKSALAEATKELVDYIGIRVTRRLSYQAVGTEGDNLSAFQRQIQESIEGRGDARVSIDVEDTYYEKFDNGTYNLSVLIRLPKQWIEQERERQKNLVRQQRNLSTKHLQDARALISQRTYQPALEALWLGLGTSGKAAENEDVYEEIRTTLLNTYQQLSLQLVSEPRYAYIEGDGDPIIVRLSDTERNTPVSGIPLEVVSADASFLALRGTTTDSQGRASYTITALTNTNTVRASIVFSFAQHSNIIAADSELAQQIAGIRQKNRVELRLTVAPRAKAQSTAVILLHNTRGPNQRAVYAYDVAMNDSLISQLADRGFNIIEVDLPNVDFSNERRSREQVINHIRTSYPNIRRVLYVLMNANALGDAGEVVGRQDLAGMFMTEVNISYSWLDLSNNQLDEGRPIRERGAGLNAAQSLHNGTQKAIRAVVETLSRKATPVSQR